MTVLENLFIGKEIYTKLGLLDTKKMKTLAQAQLDRLSVNLSLDQEAGSCSVGQKQMIEIAKALMTDAKVIIMDEPTAALTDREIEKLFQVIESLKKKAFPSSTFLTGWKKSSPFVTGLRSCVTEKRSIRKRYRTRISMKSSKMVGRELTDRYPERTPSTGDTVLEVKQATRKGRFQDVSFSVKAGEIVGVAGLMGAGRTEMMRSLFGLDPWIKEKFGFMGKRLSLKPSDAVKLGIGFITEDRKDEGLMLDASIRENIGLPNLDSFSPKGLIDKKNEQDFVDLLIKRLTIKTASSEISARSLSGGNQQKVVIAKWIGIQPKVLILDEPTRGVDVGAKRNLSAHERADGSRRCDFDGLL